MALAEGFEMPHFHSSGNTVQTFPTPPACCNWFLMLGHGSVFYEDCLQNTSTQELKSVLHLQQFKKQMSMLGFLFGV